MTRGKHSTAAATRRLREAETEIAQLKDLVLIHKAAARKAQAEAEALPALRGKVADLTRQVEECTSAEVESLRRRIGDAEAGRRADLALLARTLRTGIERLSTDDFTLTSDEWATLQTLLGVDIGVVFPEMTATRTRRRNLAHFEGKAGKAEQFMKDTDRLIAAYGIEAIK